LSAGLRLENGKRIKRLQRIVVTKKLVENGDTG
jgi:hypothetical protein